MKILNLYAGIGGNRKLWSDDHEITAVEFNPEIAEIYKKFYPNDNVIIGDAHDYLLNHFKEFDFIWSSPPCQSHSKARASGLYSPNPKYNYIYPDMSLYQEIILLKHFALPSQKWIIENVRGYYKPLIHPSQILDRHYLWSNFFIPSFEKLNNRKHKEITGQSIIYNFDLNKFNIKNKRQILRNLVDPDLGLHILKSSK